MLQLLLAVLNSNLMNLNALNVWRLIKKQILNQTGFRALNVFSALKHAYFTFKMGSVVTVGEWNSKSKNEKNGKKIKNDILNRI